MTDFDTCSRLKQLVQVCRNLPASLALEPLLQTLVETAADLLQSETCSILLYDADQHCLRFVAAAKDELQTLQQLGIPPQRSVAGWVYTHARPIKLNEAVDDERVFRVVDREIKNQTHSLLAVPLMYRGQTIGVFEAINKHEQANYTEEDLEILETLASQAAFAIENQRKVDKAQTDEQRQMEMDQLKRDLTEILSQNLREAVGQILAQSTGLMKEASCEQKPALEEITRAAGVIKAMMDGYDAPDWMEQSLAQNRVERIDLLPFTQNLVEIYQPQAAARGLNFILDVPKELTCSGDASKTAVALKNIIENALVFSEPGGSIRVQVEDRHSFIKFSVTDSGVGVPDEEREKVFERFYQGKAPAGHSQGAGLGLSIAKRMVEMQGGEIWVERAEGQGSTFAFILPDAE
jgi:signal transduction histidine kinase